MAQKGRTSTPAKSPLPNLVVEEFAQIGQKQAEAFLDIQRVMINTFERMNRDWLAGAQGLAKSATPNLAPAQPADTANKSTATLLDLQKEVTDSVESMNRDWAVRVRCEMDLAAEFTGRLTAARSVFDTAAAYQDWIGKRMELVFEDGRRLASESQKFMTATARCFSNGWTGGST
jgi:hypothetical protein